MPDSHRRHSIVLKPRKLTAARQFSFKHPFTCVVAGPTGSGKTTMVKKIIDSAVISTPPKKVIWCYTEWQSAYDQMKKEKTVQFIQGPPPAHVFDDKRPTLLVLDDMMGEISKDIEEIFTKKSHHSNTSVFLLVQNPYIKEMRTISLNSHYVMLMKNPRDGSQASIFGRQMFPGNSQMVTAAYEEATSAAHGYLMLDMTQDTPNWERVRTGILPTDFPQYIYLPLRQLTRRELRKIAAHKQKKKK